MKKISVTFIVILFISSLILGFITKSSFSDSFLDSENRNNAIVSSRKTDVISYQPDKKPDEENEITGVDTIAYELLNSDIIVEAEAVEEAKFLHQASLSTLKVKHVYKGDIKEGMLFDFYQPIFFSTSTGNNDMLFLTNMSFFNLMQAGKTYIVFANKRDLSEIYEKTIEKKVYKFVNINISWFLKEMTNPPILSENENNIITYGEIKDNEFMCFSNKQRESINNFKRSIMKDII